MRVQVDREREFLYGRRWATSALALEEADEQKARYLREGGCRANGKLLLGDATARMTGEEVERGVPQRHSVGRMIVSHGKSHWAWFTRGQSFCWSRFRRERP